MTQGDLALSAKFAQKRRDTENFLRAEMEKLGLTEQDGWKIMETTRECTGGTELVLRPFHRHLDPPKGLECVVWVIEAVADVDAECQPVTRS